MTGSPDTPLRRLLNRVPPWARPSLAVIAVGILAIPLVYAAAVWQAERDRDPETHAILQSVAIEMVRMGQIGVIPLADGSEMTMGFGRTPGVVETDPESRKYFWQHMADLSQQACKALATEYISKADVLRLRIGTVTFDRPSLLAPKPDSLETVNRACSAAQQNTLSVVLAFGEHL